MTLDPTTIDHFLIYLGLYRLGIVAAGVAGMWLGYLLFRRGLAAGGTTTDGETTLEADIGGNTLSLKGAAPGIFFALFGAGLIVAMVVTGAPGVTLSNLQQAAGADSTLVGNGGGSTEVSLVLRSQQVTAIRTIDRELTANRIDYEQAYRRLSRIVETQRTNP